MFLEALRVTSVGLIALGVLMRPAPDLILAARPTPESLGGGDRFLTALSTDKPIYHPGERVYARGVMLHATTHRPFPGAVAAMVELKGPKGEQVATANTTLQDGVWSYTWDIPQEAAGGEYTLKVSYPWQGDPPAERKFDVRAFRAPRLKSQIVFLRDGYGPGDRVTATLEVFRAEGGAPAGAAVVATARVDEAEVARVQGTVDAKGRCTVSFDLPRSIERGEGALAFTIEDGGVVETAAKTIPILLNTVDLALYPEGGDLIGGIASRVYFEARTPQAKPADIAGLVVEQDSGEPVGELRSQHEGRGRFDFTPQAGKSYAIRLTEPSGIAKTFPLPRVRAEGATLKSLKDVTAAGQPVRMVVSARGEGPFLVTLSKRERELAQATVGEGGSTVELNPGDADGVLIATVWDDRGRPLAERLVYRAPLKQVKVELKADRKRYVPAGMVKLTARTTVDGKPVSAVVGVTVTDDSVLQLLEKREQPASLPVMVLLEPEVKELADAHVYLDEKNPKAALATDLLLGTQGWRRFALFDPQRFVSDHADRALRALAQRQPPQAVALGAVGADDDFGVLGAPPPGMAEGAPAAAMPRGQRVPMAPRAAMPVPAALPPRPAPVVKAPAKAPPPQPVAVRQVPDAQPMPKGGMAKREAAAPARSEGKKVMRRPADELFAPEAEVEVPMERDVRRNRVMGKPRPPVPMFVREYAHQLRPGRQQGERTDFSETLYWHAGLRTDPQTGEATMTFALNDSVTSFKATAGAFTSEGALGSGELMLESVQPFYLEPKFPLEVTTGDVIRLPISLVNGTEDTLRGAEVKADVSAPLTAARMGAVDLSPSERARRILELKVGQGGGKAQLLLEAGAGGYTDRVERSIEVKPLGFPVELSRGGMVSARRPAVHELVIPDGIVPGSLYTSVGVYPTPVANLTSALASLIQEPYGCFEQTSSTTYPLTMAQQYFMSHSGVDPQLVSSAREKLDRGYQRLVGFECKQKGYEWFGQDPGHEALTAYGLMHFTDMGKVRQVDTAMLGNTRRWLMAQRDGQGGFERKRRALHTWVEDKDTSNAYILWALMESGEREVSREVSALKEAAGRSQNSYVVALAANVMSLAGDKAAAKQLMDRLASRQAKGGQVEGGTQSIVGSGGEALTIETTSLAALAWMRDPSYADKAERAIRYLADVCKGGRYGSTQSTVLALRAIVTYDKARARARADGKVWIVVDGKRVGDAVAFDRGTEGAITLPGFAAQLTPGTHVVKLEMEGGGEMPYSLTVKYHARTPASAPETKVALKVSLTQGSVTEGELVEATALVTNLTQEKLPTVVAIVGLPGGMEPRHDQLKELVKQGVIDAYEVRGREVIVYWRGMEAGKTNRVPLSLVAVVPGTYTGPASRAYLYYTDEHKAWVKGLEASIAPKRG
jgi:hypothetical protein